MSKMAYIVGETIQIETTQDDRGKGEITWYCQRCELSMGQVNWHSELIPCLSTITVSNISHNAAFKMFGWVRLGYCFNAVSMTMAI